MSPETAAGAALPRPFRSYVDHTLLRPEATAADVERTIAEAAEHGFASVCVPPVWVGLAARRLAGSGVAAGTVIGFPFGWVEPAVRVEESRRAVAAGARELDTVLDLSWLKSGWDERVGDDLAAWTAAMRAEASGLVLKVIVETALLTDEEKVRAALLAVGAGADYVKTSTGFAAAGATVEDVRRLAAAVGGRAGIKASGGIRDAATALALIAAGAGRLGTSRGVDLLRQVLRQIGAPPA